MILPVCVLARHVRVARKGRALSSFGVTATRLRYDAVLMYGNMRGDGAEAGPRGAANAAPSAEAFNELQNLRERALRTTETCSSKHLIGVANDAVAWLNNLPLQHPLHFPRHLTFIGVDSPFNPIWEESLTKLLQKISSISGTCTPNPSNTNGIAVSGPRGVGKSNGLRLLMMISALLFPTRIVSVYIDYTSYATAPLPRRLLLDALACALPDGATNCANEPADLQGVLDFAEEKALVTMFAADEIEEVYCNKEVWTEFHTLGTKYYAPLFVADSGSKVEAMVKRRGYEKQLRSRFAEQLKGCALPASLNESKLRVMSLPPFSKPAQYRAYWEHRAPSAGGSAAVRGAEQTAYERSQGDWPPGVAKEYETAFRTMHANTGGRLRAIESGGSEAPSLPPVGTAERFVLEKLLECHKTRHGIARIDPSSSSWDPFDPTPVSEEQLWGWLHTWHKENPHVGGAIDIFDLLDGSTIVKRVDGTYTAGTPAHLLMMDSQVPVAVSPPCKLVPWHLCWQ